MHKFHFREFKNEEHTASEVKEEVSMHLRMKSNLEITLPNVIYIGPFHVSIDHLRTFLITKRQDICNKLLDMFATRMKDCIEEVNIMFYAIIFKEIS